MVPVPNQAGGSSAQGSQKLQYSRKMLHVASAHDLPAGSGYEAKSGGTGPRGRGHGRRAPPQEPYLCVPTSGKASRLLLGARFPVALTGSAISFCAG